jgi:hypothetical protein
MPSPFGLSMKVTGAFFDRAAVLNQTDRAERKVLSRFGAFTRRGARSSIRRKGNVPRLLEEGGTATLVRRRHRGGRRVLIREQATYHKFPYMGPAFQKELPKVPSMWADSVKA